MAAGNDVFKAGDAGFDKRLFDITPHVCWRRAVKRQVTALGADYQFFARKIGGPNQSRQSFTNRSLASLKTIIGDRINDICAQLNRVREALNVTLVG